MALRMWQKHANVQMKHWLTKTQLGMRRLGISFWVRR